MEYTERQNEIVNKAVDLIANSGIQSLTIKNLSGAIGVSEPALYRHFANKYAILDAVLESFREVASEVLKKEADGEDGSLVKIGHFIQDRYKRADENPNMAKVMFSEEIFQDDPRLAAKVLQIMHSHKESIHRIIQEGQNNGEIRADFDSLVLFRIIFGPLRLLIKQWCLSNFAFDLLKEGKSLWKATEIMIKQ
jgi:AcrR family transcriptional regulator